MKRDRLLSADGGCWADSGLAMDSLRDLAPPLRPVGSSSGGGANAVTSIARMMALSVTRSRILSCHWQETLRGQASAPKPPAESVP